MYETPKPKHVRDVRIDHMLDALKEHARLQGVELDYSFLLHDTVVLTLRLDETLSATLVARGDDHNAIMIEVQEKLRRVSSTLLAVSGR